MKLNTLSILLLSTIAVILATTSAGFGQMAGGYKAITVTDAGAAAAADFAVKTQAEKSETEIELARIVKAERQVVQGSNYRLCLQVSVNGEDATYVEAVVYVDLKRTSKLYGWASSTCGEAAAAAANRPIVVGGFGKVAKTDAQVVSAANFAVDSRSAKMETEFTIDEILGAERQVVQGMNYRICMSVNVEGDEPIIVTAVIYQDLKRNYRLLEWRTSNCGVAAAGI